RPDHVARLQRECLEHLALQTAKRLLTVLPKDLGNRAAVARDDHVVGLHETASEAPREQPPTHRLSGAHEPDDDDVVARHAPTSYHRAHTPSPHSPPRRNWNLRTSLPPRSPDHQRHRQARRISISVAMCAQGRASVSEAPRIRRPRRAALPLPPRPGRRVDGRGGRPAHARARTAARTRSGSSGTWRTRAPVAAKMALLSAGATVVVPGSPRPVGYSVDGTMWISTSGTSSILSTW